MDYVYKGSGHEFHTELGELVPGRHYEVTRDQARWLSPEAGWFPAGKVAETREKLVRQAERDVRSADQAAEVPGNPDVRGDTVPTGTPPTEGS
jgi:hypothetical protein